VVWQLFSPNFINSFSRGFIPKMGEKERALCVMRWEQMSCVLGLAATEMSCVLCLMSSNAAEESANMVRFLEERGPFGFLNADPTKTTEL
jgi:hypothetical protein